MKSLNSCLNPFILNPVKALHRGRVVGISHALMTSEGLELGLETIEGYTMVSADHVMVMNDHELMRFNMLLEFLNIKEAS